MRAAGADVVAISSQLGHRSPVVTLGVYTHLFEDVFEHMPEHLAEQQRECVQGPRAKKGH